MKTKELTIEEKAKAYDRAIANAKEQAIDGYLDAVAVNDIFPELKEGEGEQHRKWILEYLYDGLRKSDEQFKDHFKTAIAWLEKQGEMDMRSYKATEDEKREFVGDGFIKCYADFQDFKEGETYWLEYVGNDNYNVRSDNLLGKTYYITPCQLYTVFKKQTWLEKKGEQKSVPTWMPTFLDELRSKKNYFDWDEHKDIEGKILAIIRWMNPNYFNGKGGEQKPAEWSEEDNKIIEEIINDIECARAINYHAPKEGYEFRKNWLKSLRFQNHWKPSDEMLEALYRVIPENTMVISEDEMLLDKLYQGLKYGRVLSNK